VVIGVISDTHGLIRPEALSALRGSNRIVHAGDIGGPEVLRALGRIAPVTAVRGNNDREPWADRLPETRVVRVAGARFFLLHDLHTLDVDPVAAGFRVVIAGHSHQPRMDTSTPAAPGHGDSGCRFRWAACSFGTAACAPASFRWW
jgi:putative phosphoesterase